MDSLKPPWWVGFPASVGFAMMGIVAPTFLPIWAQAWLFGAGAVAVVWSAFAGAWHWRRSRKQIAPSKPSERTFSEKVLGRIIETRPSPAFDFEAERERLFQIELAKLEAPERARRYRAIRRIAGGMGDHFADALEDAESDRRAEAEARRLRMIREAAQPPPPPNFDMPLKTVLERIAFESEWAATRDWSSPGDQWQETMWEKPLAKEFLNPLASGDIAARGIRGTSEGDEHGLSDIPADFWRNAKLDIHADRILCEPDYNFVMLFGDGIGYHDIVLRTVDVDRLWPARSAAEIEANPSPFVMWADEWKACFDELLLNSQMEYEGLRARGAAEARRAYYEDRPQLTLREAACLVADISPVDFERSEKAQSIANQLIYYATTGAMPIATEPEGTRAARKAAVSMGGIEVPQVTMDSFVTREALEHYRDQALRTWMEVQDPARSKPK